MRQFFAFVVGVLKNPDPSRTLAILSFLIIGAAIPLTVYVTQQQQDVRQQAEGPFACYENRGCTVGPNDEYEQCGGDAHLTCPDGVPDGRYQPTDRVGVIRYHCSDGTYYLTSPIPSKNYLCQPTSTTTPPGVTVVLTPIPTGPAPCATPRPKNQGNANDDCSINIADYNIWRSEFLGTTNTKRADFDGNNVVDLIDFNIWRNNIYNLVQP